MDVTAARVSDETETEFVANVALAAFDGAFAEGGTGYTLQFAHQGVQWGPSRRT